MLIVKKCIKCNKTKPITEFYRIGKNKDKFSKYCKKCNRVQRLINILDRKIYNCPQRSSKQSKEVVELLIEFFKGNISKMKLAEILRLSFSQINIYIEKIEKIIIEEYKEFGEEKRLKTKVCPKCKKKKDIKKFYKHKRAKDGLSHCCKKCSTENSMKHYMENKEYYKKHHKKYYIKNRKKISEYNHKYYEKNKEKINKRSTEWSKSNPEKVRETYRRYYRDNKEKVLKGRKIYYQENKEKIKKYQEEYRKKIIRRKNEIS